MGAFQYERLLGLCFNCGLLGHEAKVSKSAGYREGGESLYGDWLRAGFRKPSVITRHQTPSPSRRNMDEANGSNDRYGRSQSSLPTICSEPGTSTGNPDDDAAVKEYGEQQLTIFTEAATVDNFHGNGS